MFQGIWFKSKVLGFLRVDFGHTPDDGLECWVFNKFADAGRLAKVDARMVAQDFWYLRTGMYRTGLSDTDGGIVPREAMNRKFSHVLAEAKRLDAGTAYGYLKLKAQHLAWSVSQEVAQDHLK